ncbi:ankyrin repeat-containing domain protein [Mucidula mucida]|nr:ankyrin repeat-containing domain protein [Mucidula mucida]
MEESDEEEFVYPGGSTTGEPGSHTSTPAVPRPTPAQLESLYAAASSGDLRLLKKLFKTALESASVEPFSLANAASTRTGLTALHAAASRGFLDIVTWLVQDCGAMADLEDKEGETALHKAALNGHLPIILYLLPDKADVHTKDGDGWTALHNACSKVGPGNSFASAPYTSIGLS